jgi:hypothetical protein
MEEAYCRCPGCGVCSAHAEVERLKKTLAKRDETIRKLRERPPQKKRGW